MRGKTEKELMELILQRGQRELADEEAAEVSLAGDMCVLGHADAVYLGIPAASACGSLLNQALHDAGCSCEGKGRAWRAAGG